jgi:hypothetical protein
MFFRFPTDARWNPDRKTVEFGIGVGEYEGVVRVSRRVFPILLPDAPAPERCLEPWNIDRRAGPLLGRTGTSKDGLRIGAAIWRS